MRFGKTDALAEIKLAEQYDPLNLTLKVVAGLPFAYAGRHSEALEQLRNAAALETGVSVVHWATGVALQHAGRHDEAVTAFQAARGSAPGSLFSLGDLGCAYAAAGQPEQARASLKELQALSGVKPVPPHSFALVHAGLGETGPALDWLERACDERSDFVIYLQADARLVLHQASFEGC